MALARAGEIGKMEEADTAPDALEAHGAAITPAR
jgi:hypothetical protein